MADPVSIAATARSILTFANTVRTIVGGGRDTAAERAADLAADQRRLDQLGITREQISRGAEGIGTEGAFFDFRSIPEEALKRLPDVIPGAIDVLFRPLPPRPPPVRPDAPPPVVPPRVPRPTPETLPPFTPSVPLPELPTPGPEFPLEDPFPPEILPPEPVPAPPETGKPFPGLEEIPFPRVPRLPIPERSPPRVPAPQGPPVEFEPFDPTQLPERLPPPAPARPVTPGISRLAQLGVAIAVGTITGAGIQSIARGRVPGGRQFVPGTTPGIPTVPAPVPVPTPVPQGTRTRTRTRERDNCEKRARKNRKVCWRGFYEEFRGTKTEFTKWEAVDCVTRKRIPGLSK